MLRLRGRKIVKMVDYIKSVKSNEGEAMPEPLKDLETFQCFNCRSQRLALVGIIENVTVCRCEVCNQLLHITRDKIVRLFVEAPKPQINLEGAGVGEAQRVEVKGGQDKVSG